MALTRQQFDELRSQGLSVEQIVAFDRGETPKDLAQKQQITQQTAGNQFQRTDNLGTVEGAISDTGDKNPARRFFSKAIDFTSNLVGGGKLAEGIGMSLASSDVIKNTQESNAVTEFQQKKILEMIREKKERGEDTKNLINILKKTQGTSTITNDALKDYEEALPTNKQVIGSAVRLATLAAGGTATKLAGKLTGASKATTFMSGALRGGAAGALSGGAIGGLEGLGYGAEQNMSSGDILLSGALGAGTGAAFGLGFGTLSGGIYGTMKGRAISKENFAKEFVKPKESFDESASAIEEGRLQDADYFQKAKLMSSKRDELLADSVKDVISPRTTVGQNIDAIRYKINNTNAAVKQYITENPSIFNQNQLRSRLMAGKEDLKLIFASDKQAEKTYNAVVDAFMDQIKENKTLGLFNARQEFDKIPAIRKLLDTDRMGENARREIALAVRRAANDYIADLLPSNNKYKELMRMESYMIEAKRNIAEKSVAILGKDKIDLLAKEYPFLKYIMGGIGAGIPIGAGYGITKWMTGGSSGND